MAVETAPAGDEAKKPKSAPGPEEPQRLKAGEGLDAASLRIAAVKAMYEAQILLEDSEDSITIARAVGLQQRDVLVAFSHTHSGPATDEEVGLSGEYRMELVSKVTQAAIEASARTEDCDFGWGVSGTIAGRDRRSVQTRDSRFRENPEIAAARVDNKDGKCNGK